MPDDRIRPGRRAANAETLIDLALAEDLGEVGDLTADGHDPRATRRGCGPVRRPVDGVIAGLPVARAARRAVRAGGRLRSRSPTTATGSSPGTVVAAVAGPMRTLLAMERTALNFLQRLSGVATLTARFVAEVAGTKAVDPRHPQDHARLAGAGEVRRPLRRRAEPPDRPL